MITISELSVSLDGNDILRDVGFSVADRSLVAIMGPSGCGKSTLLKALIGLNVCASGKIQIDELPNESLTDWSTSQSTFSLVPQAPLLLPWKNALQNILTAKPTRMNLSEATAQAKSLLARVELVDACDLYPWQLSQGMAARVSLARTLMMKSRVLLLDEPFAAIDATTRFKLQRWMLELVDQLGQAAILVTHDPREALLLADEIIVLNGRPAGARQRFKTPLRNVRRESDWIFGPEAGELEKEIRLSLEKI